ncbi:MAG: tRNA (N(6)-L-threonylcarbamoyladenosine(37)-C(2))-methylthiotransferase MtaB, partial [Atribacterota bacterium]
MIQKVAFKTLGCKVNQYESESLKQAFMQNNFQVTEFKEKADIYIINTCAVTSEAERKSRQMIRKVFRMNPFATIIVTGCGVQSNLYDIKKCIDNGYIISNYYKEKIFSIIQDTKFKTSTEEKTVYFQPANLINKYNETPFPGAGTRIRGFVKIQDGCNQ